MLEQGKDSSPKAVGEIVRDEPTITPFPTSLHYWE